MLVIVQVHFLEKEKLILLRWDIVFDIMTSQMQEDRGQESLHCTSCFGVLFLPVWHKFYHHSSWRMSSSGMWRCVDLALTDVSEEHRLHLQDRKVCERITSMSRWLQTEPPVGNNQLYKNGERETRSHGKSTERRGVGSVMKVTSK
jgi:hypothetical protein